MPLVRRWLNLFQETLLKDFITKIDLQATLIHQSDEVAVFKDNFEQNYVFVKKKKTHGFV